MSDRLRKAARMSLRLSVLPLTLLLAACAGEPVPPPPEAAAPIPVQQPMAAVAPMSVPGGEWMVTEIFGPEPLRAQGGLVGRRIRLDKEMAIDPLGRPCPLPTYGTSQTGEAEFLGGLPARTATDMPARMTTLVEVTCDGKPFARFASWRDGSLLTRVGGSILRLARSETQPQPQPEDVKPSPVVTASAPPPPAAGETLVYLASYNGNATAQRGWRRLKAQSKMLASLDHETKDVNLPGKGRFIRLFAKAKSAEQARQLCSELRHQIPDCGIGWR
jgi:hypothetical protein